MEQDNTENKCYLILSTAGSYDTYVSIAKTVYESKEDAEKFIKEKKDWKENINNKNIMDERQYSHIIEEFDEKLINEICSGRDLFTEEEADLYNEKMNNEKIKKYIQEKYNCTEEEAEATVICNDNDEWDEYNTEYRIQEIPYIKKKGFCIKSTN